MKKCSKCGSVCSDDDAKCGVCGSSLERAVSVSLGEASRIEESLTLERKHVGKTGIVVLLLGIVLAVSGGFSMVLIGPLGLAILVVGVFVVLIGIDLMGRDRFYIRGGVPGKVHSYKGAPSGLRTGSRSYNEEANRERAKDKDRESGDAD